MRALLSRTDFRERTEEWDRRAAISMVNALGGPRMQVLEASVLEELGNLPRSSDGRAIDAIEALDHHGAEICEIFMVSHQWLRPSLDSVAAHPDDAEGSKAVALAQFARWRRQWIQTTQGFTPKIFFWLDFACFDQDSGMFEAIQLLPAWVACCDRFLRIDTPGYSSRAWCRLEPLLSFAFGWAEHQVTIPSHSVSRYPLAGVRARQVLLDPREGALTNPADMQQLTPIVELALEAARARDPHFTLGTTSVTTFDMSLACRRGFFARPRRNYDRNLRGWWEPVDARPFAAQEESRDEIAKLHTQWAKAAEAPAELVASAACTEPSPGRPSPTSTRGTAARSLAARSSAARAARSSAARSSVARSSVARASAARTSADRGRAYSARVQAAVTATPQFSMASVLTVFRGQAR